MMRPLLIPLTYFCLQTWLGIPQAKCEELNMSNDAFDDQYLGCAKEMEEKARELLKREMSPPFSTVWEKATKKWEDVKSTSPLRDYEDKYGIALVAYTDKTRVYNSKAFPTIFNEAVESAGTSRAYYMANFQFKAFHYYLTRALQLLRKECNKVYRGDPKSFKYKEGDIRFGHFASSSLREGVAEEFSKGGTLFTIHTCFGVKIQALSYSPVQEEVLIPVHETFSVSPQGNNRFVLRSTKQTCSHFNCTYLGGEKIEACVNNSATRGSLAFPGVLSPSLFGGSIILVHVAALKLFAGF